MTVDKQKVAPVKKATLQSKCLHSNSPESQRQRILAELRRQPLSTIKIRRDLDILGPAPRIFELKHKLGYDIRTMWTWEPTECAQLHRVAYYHLIGEAKASQGVRHD